MTTGILRQTPLPVMTGAWHAWLAIYCCLNSEYPRIPRPEEGYSFAGQQ